MTSENWKELSPVGLWAALAHAFSVLALGAGMYVYPLLSSQLPSFLFFEKAQKSNQFVLRSHIFVDLVRCVCALLSSLSCAVTLS